MANSQESSINVIYKFHPLAAINPDRPSLTATAEILFNKKLGIEAGYGRRHANSVLFQDSELDTLHVPFSGHTILFEITLYNPSFIEKFDRGWHSTLAPSEHYVGIAYRYIEDLRNEVEYYIDNDDKSPGSRPFLKDCFAVQRHVHVLVLKAGSLKKFDTDDTKYSIEFYGEVGIRYKNLKYLYAEIEPFEDVTPDGIFFWQQPYRGIFPTLNFGFKVNMHIPDF
ncbi:MAG: hypothetical protein V4642_16100 [Bacteroidota bacterium]